MENLSWAHQPLQQFLDESPNSDSLTQVTKALVQATKSVKRAKLRLELECLLQRQYIEYKRNFNAELQLQSLPSCELATKLFHRLQEKGMVVYGYIHHTDGLEAQVLELDDEDINLLIESIGNFLEAKREQQNPGIVGIYLWLSMQSVNACSDILPDDLKDDKNNKKVAQNEKRRLKRKRGSDPKGLESIHNPSTLLQYNSSIPEYQTPYPQIDEWRE
ncbi:hypothetical protein HYALB_00000968 [Hymenoscyphus albidus]|uniref:Uncharacterized protein n=1 Tax=Hymenoscyphus albidus TaxID=595503 RepID=A0A9N9M259_9HELO|nr:hypothetical protein HYALB_00000968 [Hymenoscyphus albidus]